MLTFPSLTATAHTIAQERCDAYYELLWPEPAGVTARTVRALGVGVVSERDDSRDCKVRDGRFVDPCESLASVVANNTPGFSAVKGIAQWNMTNIETHQPSRTYFGVKTKEMPNGFLFNFCPFCGVKIDEPFNPETSA